MGMLLAIFVFGVISVCVGDTIAELVQIFPAPNAIFEYVYAFVDEELAWVICASYWYTFASVFANELLNAAKLIRYWNPSPIWPPLAFYGFAPLVLFAMNFPVVNVFGWIETVGGVLKVALIFGISVALIVVSAHDKSGNAQGPFNDGFQHDDAYTTSNGMAFCFAFPLVALSFIGIENTAVAAFEARSIKDISRPSRLVHWITWALYLFVTIGIILTVKWTDTRLPAIYGSITGDSRAARQSSQKDFEPIGSDSAVVIGIHDSTLPGAEDLAGFVNACLVFSVLSAGNTALYVASRTLYGLTYRLQGQNPLTRLLKSAGRLTHRPEGVPAIALGMTVILTFWLPWLQLSGSLTIEYVIEFIGITSSIACINVWAALCLAFIRFHKCGIHLAATISLVNWSIFGAYSETRTRLCADGLKAEGFGEYVRESTIYKKKGFTFLFWAQPGADYVGIVGCFLVFVFASATWWATSATFIKVAAAYGTQVIFLVLWVLLKVSKRKWTEWWVPIVVEPVPRRLVERLRRLGDISKKSWERGANEGTRPNYLNPGNRRDGNSVELLSQLSSSPARLPRQDELEMSGARVGGQ